MSQIRSSRPNRYRSQIIDLEPVRNSKADVHSSIQRRFPKWMLILTLIVGILVASRVIGTFIFKEKVAQDAETFARVAGFNPLIGGWLTGTFSLIVGLILFGFISRFIARLFLPTPKRILLRDALIIVCISGMGAVSSTTFMYFRDVDVSGRSKIMNMVDPATSDWFTPTGECLIFYADHLDGERRFWNRPGTTPRDAAEAKPVSQEVYRSWLEKQRPRTSALYSRGGAVEEYSFREKQKHTNLEDVSRNESNEDETPHSVAQAGEITFSEVPAQRHIIPGSNAVAPPVSSTDSRIKPADAKAALLPGRVLCLNFSGRAFEFWADGTVEVKQGPNQPSVLLGANKRRRFNVSDTLMIRPVSETSTEIYMRWLEVQESSQEISGHYLHEWSLTISSPQHSMAAPPQLPPQSGGSRGYFHLAHHTPSEILSQGKRSYVPSLP